MNELDHQLHVRKIKYFIFDMIVLASIGYALYTYVYPILRPYIY